MHGRTCELARACLMHLRMFLVICMDHVLSSAKGDTFWHASHTYPTRVRCMGNTAHGMHRKSLSGRASTRMYNKLSSVYAGYWHTHLLCHRLWQSKVPNKPLV
ncbi:uncharacterized protein SPPG_09188 [Spizellomyces punctatus DAOM BR117]|uniref:Secreted protein n=1 Tax=Spizellomyces punctatus (strain DAOM BR117) TaxID=645134 RepID=A0A0L0HGU4_SPIPD|nr:uncharacterized protein SPPG_09188 [Spizellomyces punctatus DAOM BR117]KND00029.1 hypothetical protein SPPG_09188 [Spizellomyces punctatus DAOM BR117]|eukprot:XP_016608068.1 hypothetical protein SPPG_09188 [Spizellomyces punctatus DAOM BR117]